MYAGRIPGLSAHWSPRIFSSSTSQLERVRRDDVDAAAPGPRQQHAVLVLGRLDAELLELRRDVVGELDLVRRPGVMRLGGHHVEVRLGELRRRRRLHLALARGLGRARRRGEAADARRRRRALRGQPDGAGRRRTQRHRADEKRRIKVMPNS